MMFMCWKQYFVVSLTSYDNPAKAMKTKSHITCFHCCSCIAILGKTNEARFHLGVSLLASLDPLQTCLIISYVALLGEMNWNYIRLSWIKRKVRVHSSIPHNRQRVRLLLFLHFVPICHFYSDCSPSLYLSLFLKWRMNIILIMSLRIIHSSIKTQNMSCNMSIEVLSHYARSSC